MSESKSLFLIVKGPPDVALAEAARHGIEEVTVEGQCRGAQPLKYMSSLSVYYNTYLRTQLAYQTACREWFNEDLGAEAPFREGALLWWSYSPKEA